jgi:hypothetical protein
MGDERGQFTDKVWTRPTIAGFESGGKEAQDNKCEWLPELGGDLQLSSARKQDFSPTTTRNSILSTTQISIEIGPPLKHSEI